MGVPIALFVCMVVSYVVGTAVYNLFFHPLAKHPGPFFARLSNIPSFYHATKGDRHIWAWRNFQIYGDKFRASPQGMLFQTPEASDTIYGYGANVAKSSHYDIFVRNKHYRDTNTERDVAKHAKRRKILSKAFTDKTLKSTIPIMIKHIDRWNELLPGEKPDTEGWSEPQNAATWADYLMFDLFSEICFGTSNEIKEPGPNKLKSMPHNINAFMRFGATFTKMPFRDQFVWLKLNLLAEFLESLTPKDIKHYFAYVDDLAKSRITTARQNDSEKGLVEQETMFDSLCKARNPDTGEYALTPAELNGDINLLTVAGSDTTGTATSAFFFFITRNPRVYTKLVKEIRESFQSADQIGTTPDLMAKCEYLRAVISEIIRLAPPGPGEFERIVRQGGITIGGESYPEGTLVGVPVWSLGRNERTFGDSNTFRPERWIVSDDPNTLNTKEDLKNIKTGWNPFLKGPGNCPGQAMAQAQLSIIIAKTLWRYDVRKAPGQTLGEGHPDLGWGQRNPNHYMLVEAHIALHDGPMVQFKKREL